MRGQAEGGALVVERAAMFLEHRKTGGVPEPPVYQKEENLCTAPDSVHSQYTDFLPDALDVNLTLT